MIKQLLTLSIIALILGCTIPQIPGFQLTSTPEFRVKIHWLGHAGVYIESQSKRIYINPYSAPMGSLKGEALIVTHSVSDLCDLMTLNALSKDESIIIAAPECSARLAKSNTLPLKVGKSYTVSGFTIETVDAYQINGTLNKGEGVGLIITVNNTRIYYAGLTDLIPEMDNINNIDVAIVPIAGEDLTMDMNEAIILLKKLKAEYNIPMYYGGQTGTTQDAGRQFKTLAENQGVNVTLLSNQDLLIN